MANYNPTKAAMIDDPFPILRDVRAMDPVFSTTSGLLLTGYQGCREVTADAGFRTSGLTEVVAESMGPGRVAAFFGRRFHARHPPDHTRLRRPYTAMFARPAVQALAGSLEAAASRYTAKLAARSRFDVVAEFCWPFSIESLFLVIGDGGSAPQMAEWAVPIMDLQGAYVASDAQRSEGERAYAAFHAHVSDMLLSADLLDRRDGAVGALVEAVGHGNLTWDDAIENYVFLVNAGLGNTAKTLAGGLAALLANREAWSALVDDPSLIAVATEEVLRMANSLSVVPRCPIDDVALGRRHVPAGSMLFCRLDAANRDPAEFDEPDTFRLDRVHYDHLAFGGGVHTCLGKSLARLQISTALKALTADLPYLRLGGRRVSWSPGVYRGPVDLEVVVGR